MLKINNISTRRVSIDTELSEGRILRLAIPPGGSREIGNIATLDELYRNPQIQALLGIAPVGAPRVSITGDAALTLPSLGATVFTIPAEGAVAGEAVALTPATEAGFITVKMRDAAGNESLRYLKTYSVAPAS